MNNRLKDWLFDLGEKTSRSDIWVVLFSLITLTSAACFFLCGLGLLNHCNDDFISYNFYILVTCLSCITVDLGIKSWNSESKIEQIVKKLFKINSDKDNIPL